MITRKLSARFAITWGITIAITIALSTFLDTLAPVVAQNEAPTAIKQLKKYLQEAYVAAQDNDMLSVLGALDDANRALLLVELQTLGPANNNMTDQINMTTAGRSHGQANNTDSLLTYQNFKAGIKIKYPSDWQVREDPNLVAIFTSANATLNIGVEDLPTKTISLNRYTYAALSKLRSVQDFNMTESEDTTLAGFPAHKIIYTTMFQGSAGIYPLKTMQVWTVKDGKAYIVTFGTLLDQFSESLADAQTMLNSFEIVNLGSPPPTISAQVRIG
jgi:hypothetical protein